MGNGNFLGPGMGRDYYKLVVGGGRDFLNYKLLCSVLDDTIDRLTRHRPTGYHLEIIIVSGGARGTDTLAKLYAEERGYAFKLHKALWDRQGKRAGALRNVEMVKDGDFAYFFWDGRSPGTKHAIECAKKHLTETHELDGETIETRRYRVVLYNNE